jgi:hypothetical protein
MRCLAFALLLFGCGSDLGPAWEVGGAAGADAGTEVAGAAQALLLPPSHGSGGSSQGTGGAAQGTGGSSQQTGGTSQGGTATGGSATGGSNPCSPCTATSQPDGGVECVGGPGSNCRGCVPQHTSTTCVVG